MTCELDNNRYAVSVATALLFDTACEGDQLVAKSETLLNSSITQAIQSTTVYAGKGSQAQFEFNYQKEITVSLEDSVFNPVYLAAQNGTTIASKLSEFFTTEEVTFDATGLGTLKGTPTGNVQVPINGSFSAVIPTGSTITVPAFAGKTVAVTYPENKQLKTLVIDAKSFPKTLKLVLTIDIFDNEKGLVEQMQVTIPRFKPDGNMEISLTHDGVATSSLAGKALSCGGKYATITFNPVDNGKETCLTQIVTMPNKVELDEDVVGDSAAITVLGVRGLGNTLVPNSKITWSTSDDDTAIVNANGVITLVANPVASSVIVTATVEEGGKTFTDTVVVNLAV